MWAIAASPLEAFPTEITHDFLFDGFVPQVPVPILPVSTLTWVAGSTPLALMVADFSVDRLHCAELCTEARHSRMKTWSPGVKPEPVTRTLWPFFKLVDGATLMCRGPRTIGAVVVVVAGTVVVVVVVVVVPPGVVVVVVDVLEPKEIVAVAFSAWLFWLPTTSKQVVSVVPRSHEPEPVVPAKTWKVAVNPPDALVVGMGTSTDVLHVVRSVEPRAHSSAKRLPSLAPKPVPVMVTAWPSVRPVEGVTTMLGVADDAAVTPNVTMDPYINAPMAIPDMILFMLYFLPFDCHCEHKDYELQSP